MTRGKEETMPQTVTKDITYAGVRVGDTFGTHDTDRVAGIERKPVWVTLTFVGGSTRRRRGDEPVTVWRSEPTAEEVAADRRHHAAEQLRGKLGGYLHTAAFTEFNESVQIALANDHVNTFDHWQLDKILRANALRNVGQLIDHARQQMVKRAADQGIELDADSEIIDGFAAWYANDIERADRISSPNDPLSRSTSLTSNLLEDLKRWAVEQVVSDLKWMTMSVVTDRAAELRREWDAERKWK
jgi:hypothetical protein